MDEVPACYPGITAIVHHRLAHSLHSLGAPFVARIIAELSHAATGIAIYPGAQIKGSFFIDHGTGVVIGETAIFGERVRLDHASVIGGNVWLTRSIPPGSHITQAKAQGEDFSSGSGI